MADKGKAAACGDSVLRCVASCYNCGAPQWRSVNVELFYLVVRIITAAKQSIYVQHRRREKEWKEPAEMWSFWSSGKL
jgi:hypothetical protein